MIFVNNKLVDFDSPLPEFKEIATDYKAKITNLRNRFGKTVTIKSRKEPKINATGLVEPVANSTIPLYVSTRSKNGREEWLYCDHVPEIKDGIVNPETKQRIVQRGEFDIDLESDPDFAYFFMEKHGMFKSGKYSIVDNERDENIKAEKRVKETKLNSVVYGENSQLNLDLDFLRLVSKRWGIADADLKAKAVLQNQLFDIVQDAETKKKGRGIKEFLEDIKTENSFADLEVSGVVRDGIDQHVLQFNEIDSKWVINYKDGSYKNVVSVSIADRPQKEEVLILYMQSDNTMYALLKSALGLPTGEIVAEIDKEAVRNTDSIADLRAWGKSLGIKLWQKSRDDLRQEILDKISQTT